MSDVVVVYESMFGDAKNVALAIGAGLAAAGSVDCIEVGVAPTSFPVDLRLLVVGSPNHGFSLPRESSREQAREKSDQPLVSAGIGVREWLKQLERPHSGASAVTFDTRMSHPKTLTKLDHASHSSAHALKGLGYALLTKSEHFLVTDVTGPLADGELERARSWGAQLAELLGDTSAR